MDELSSLQIKGLRASGAHLFALIKHFKIGFGVVLALKVNWSWAWFEIAVVAGVSTCS